LPLQTGTRHDGKAQVDTALVQWRLFVYGVTKEPFDTLGGWGTGTT
jgi:hypothetical protein